ncbi:MAG TPA: M14 family zinc carboxypeptidase [Longimicrobium sp.]|uniref:M14 family zinc carboxypeptidase n=1 Tax=Longimicrobium sp. TaxID=2029185 RepID=UPI002ED9D35E
MPALTARQFTHRELWNALGTVVDAPGGPEREEVGRSAEGRPIYTVSYGRGATRVLLWSQMHGNESTASMALADLFRFLAAAPDDPRARRIAERLTIVAVPMLNPDGAERFQRRNAMGIDVNRDARALVTPEARILRAVHQRFRPEFGFNLHDQDVRARVGSSDRLAAIALLAPPFDRAGDDNPVRMRAKRIAAVIRVAAEPLVAGHVTRYDDTFNPRAFGDLMQSWGTSTVLIESGGWRDDPEKQYLRKVNFVALVSALDAIATESYTAADPALYEELPENGRSVNDLLVRGATIVLPGIEPYRADLSINFADALAHRDGRITEIGDLAEAAARDTIDATGLYLHPAPAMLSQEGPAAPVLTVDSPAIFVLRRTPDRASEGVWSVGASGYRRTPD